MDRLYEALSRMIVILENANRAVTQDALQGIKDEHVKLDKLLDQNEKLARAVVALADEVRGPRRAQYNPPPRNIPPSPMMQAMPPPTQTAATPMPAPPSFAAAPLPHMPLPTPPAGHDESSFLSQPVMVQVPTSNAPTFVPPAQSMPAPPNMMQAPPPPPLGAGASAPSAGQLPPLPPLPAMPPSAAPDQQRRPILRSFG